MSSPYRWRSSGSVLMSMRSSVCAYRGRRLVEHRLGLVAQVAAGFHVQLYGKHGGSGAAHAARESSVARASRVSLAPKLDGWIADVRSTARNP